MRIMLLAMIAAGTIVIVLLAYGLAQSKTQEETLIGVVHAKVAYVVRADTDPICMAIPDRILGTDQAKQELHLNNTFAYPYPNTNSICLMQAGTQFNAPIWANGDITNRGDDSWVKMAREKGWI